MPEEWKNKKLNEELDYQRQIIEKTEAMLEIHRNNEKEDDEDLKNWQL